MSGAEVMHDLDDEFSVAAQDELERRGLFTVHRGEVGIRTVEPDVELGHVSAAPEEGVCHVFKRLKLGLNGGACGGLSNALLGHTAEASDVGVRDSE